MKTLTQESIPELTVENYVHLIIEKKQSVDFIKRQIQNFSLEESDKEKALQRLQFAVERIDRSLSASEVLMLLFIPFGYFKFKLGTSLLFDIRKERESGFVNRVKQFYLISIIGVLMYILIIPGLYLSLK